MKSSRYADETTTGARHADLRDHARILIAARIDHCEIDWLRGLKERLLPGVSEIKSEHFMSLLAAHPSGKREFERGIAAASIVVVDVGWDILELFRDSRRELGLPEPDFSELRAILRSRHTASLAAGILRAARERYIQRSAVPRLEYLVSLVGPVPGVIPRPGVSLFDREALQEMPRREFEETVARFSVALGDALKPEVRASAIVESLEGDRRFVVPGEFAFRTLERTTEPDTRFDVGYTRAFSAVSRAHELVTKRLQSSAYAGQWTGAGSIDEDDSKKVLGIQVADLAAGYARTLFEKEYPTTASAAHVLKKHFAAVLLNQKWL